MTSNTSGKRKSLLDFGFGATSQAVPKGENVLCEIDAEQAQNKRRKTLHSVLVTKPSDSEIAEFLHIDQAVSNGKLVPAKPPVLTVTPSHTTKPSITSRSGRNIHQVRYTTVDSLGDFDGSGSDHSTKPTVRQRSQKQTLDESDYEIIDESDEVDDDQDAVPDDTSSITSATEETMSDDEMSGPAPPKARVKAQSTQTASPMPASNAKKGSNKHMLRLLTRPKGQPSKGLDTSLPPMFDINDIFSDLTRKALDMGLKSALKNLTARPLRVATMCSGTESPLLALEMICDSLKSLGLSETIQVEHLFSAEIVPYKQAYIERNFAPPLIFRDITEFIDVLDDEIPMATTAYGAKVPLPTHPDIVVAGTSCVDFSRLNNQKKGLGDGGESDRTWHGAMAYCRKYRPAIILFENIVNADWDLMREHYQNIDYDCEGVLVDTKDYYIPHTRQRGYMVCFDKRKPSYTKGLGEKWQKLMGKFKRLASSPVSSFLLPNDQVIARQQSRSDDNAREVDWSRCEITQMKYRQDERLGNARPFTHWQESGYMLVPENGHSPWYHAQVERVLDTIDCSILRKAHEKPEKKKEKGDEDDDGSMYDARFKTRIWDLSQNIYRETDHTRFGMTGCITPSGQFFISDAGRAMAAEEALILQGIPLEKITFTTETQKELQDLAGNAMTSTVVGASLAAALIAGSALFESKDISDDTVKMVMPVQSKFVKGGGISSATTDSRLHSIDVCQLLQTAKNAMKRCFCEGSRGVSEKGLQKCIDCGHTTCLACGGDPRHTYRPDRALRASRISPGVFEEELRSKVPLMVEFKDTIDFRSLFSIKDSNNRLVNNFINAAHGAVSSIYYIASVRRTHCWTISYTTRSNTSHLNLVLEDGLAQWQLYVRAAKSLAVNDSTRKSFDQPIATAVVSDTIFPTRWLWRSPIETSNSLSITGKGAKVPTWWARSEMPDYKDHTQWDQLQIELEDESQTDLASVIDGTYQYLPMCGKACDSLYKKLSQEPGCQPMYLFLDPTRTGNAQQDCFVFSTNKSELQYDEVRLVAARIDSGWRPWPNSKRKQMNQKDMMLYHNEWKPANVNFSNHLSQLRFEHPTKFGTVLSDMHCSDTLILSSGVFSDQGVSCHGAGNKAYDRAFLSEMASVLEAMRRQLPSPEWRSLPTKHALEPCQLCAPTRPAVRWKLTDVDSVVKPYEDAASAATYERAVKSRLDPIVITTNVHGSDTELIFGVNPVTLAHRAVSRLPRGINGVTLKWRLETSQTSRAFVFRPFTLIATTGVEPFIEDTGMTVRLFPQQALAVSWMRKQEQGVNFTIEEAEEAVIPGLGWRAEVRARGSLTFRGGICADHPGFGKTITSLALIHAAFHDQNAAEILSDLKSRSNEGPSKGLLPTTATLIVCPGTLIRQWVAEACEKLLYKVRHNGNGEVISINTVGDLDKHSILDFERARIVFVNRSVLGSEAYVERLANFAGVPGPAAKLGRSLSQWLKFAMSQVPEHLQIMRSQSLQALRSSIKEKYQAHLASEEFKAVVPSRRLRGSNYIAANTKKAEKSKKPEFSKPALTSIDTKHVDRPLFEMFYFNRLVIDEFHQYESKEYAALTALQADKTWGLSATPALGDFYDIAQMAGLLGVPLRIGSDARGIMKLKNVRELRKEMTDFERFDTMRQIHSDSIHERIYDIDQEFLNTFVRRNIMDVDEMKYHDWLYPVNLDLDHRVVYTELSQHLNSSDMRIRRGRKTQATDRDQRLSKAVATSDTAEESLSKTAACYERDDSEDGMSSLVDRAQDEVTKLLTKVANAVHAAKSAEKDAFESWKKTRLIGNNGLAPTLGDDSVIQEIQNYTKLTREPESKQAKKKVKSQVGSQSDSGDDAKLAKVGGNVKISELNTQTKRLVVAWRSLRFFKNVSALQLAARGDESCTSVLCDSTDCGAALSIAENPCVSSLCGHAVCRSCFGSLKTKRCVAAGCLASMDESHLLWVSKMGDLQQTTYTSFGTKMEAAMNILVDIQNKKEQAILFVQYVNQVDEVELALKSRRIPAIVVKESSKASQQIREFQESSSNTKSVIVLNASDETAAGSNLQNANHVIFFSPLLRDSQYGYDSTMAQAIGRVRRYGQKRKIQVYRIVALDTIDVDILEHRERRSDALVEQGQAPMENPVDPREMDCSEKESKKAQRTQLVRENGTFSLRPRSWLVSNATEEEGEDGEEEKIKRRDRVHGWEDFSSLIKWSRAYTEDDD